MELTDHLVFLDPLVLKAKPDQKANQATKEIRASKGTADEQVYGDQRETAEIVVLRGLQALPGMQERMELTELQVHQERLVLRALVEQLEEEENLETKDKLDKRGRKDYQVRLEYLVFLERKDRMENLVLLENKDLWVLMAMLARLENKEIAVERVAPDEMELQVRKVLRDLLARWDLKAYQVVLDDREILVVTDGLVHEERGEIMAEMDSEVYQAHPVTEEIQALKDRKDHKVQLVDQVAAVKLDLQANRVLQDQLVLLDHVVLVAVQEALVLTVKTENADFPVLMEPREIVVLMVLLVKTAFLELGELQDHQAIRVEMEKMAQRVKPVKMETMAWVDLLDPPEFLDKWELADRKENKAHLANQAVLELLVSEEPPVLEETMVRVANQEFLEEMVHPVNEVNQVQLVFLV